MIGLTAADAADAAESDCLIWALVDAYFDHREKCTQCAGPLPCEHVGRAIDEVISWHRARALLSAAQALRIEAELQRWAA